MTAICMVGSCLRPMRFGVADPRRCRNPRPRASICSTDLNQVALSALATACDKQRDKEARGAQARKSEFSAVAGRRHAGVWLGPGTVLWRHSLGRRRRRDLCAAVPEIAGPDGRAAESRRRGDGADRDCDGASAAGLDRGVPAAGSLRPLCQVPVRRVQPCRLHPADVRRAAGLGDRAAGSLQPDGFHQGSRQRGGGAREGRTGGGAAGAEHRHEHLRLHDRPRHHAVSAVLPAARRQGAGRADQAGGAAARRPEDRVVQRGSPMSSAPR